MITATCHVSPALACKQTNKHPSVRLLQVAQLSHCVTSLTSTSPASRLSLGGVETTRFVLHIFISPLTAQRLVPGV